MIYDYLVDIAIDMVERMIYVYSIYIQPDSLSNIDNPKDKILNPAAEC